MGNKRYERTTLDTESFNRALAAEVRGIAAKKSVRQSELKEAFGWEQTYVSRRWTGSVPWGQADLIRVCDYLDVDITDVLAAAKSEARRSYLAQIEREHGRETAAEVARSWSRRLSEMADEERGEEGKNSTSASG